MAVRQEDQLGELQRQGRLNEIGWNPQEARERAERTAPFLDTLGRDLGVRNGGQEDRMRHAQTMDAWRQVQRVGLREFTVVSVMPWAIDITCGVFPHYVKRADYKKGEEFHIRTFGVKDCRVDQRDLGDGKVSPTILLPVEIAREFVDKYVGKEGETEEDADGHRINNKPGGLFVYEGDEHHPPANFFELLAEAKQRMADFFWTQYQAGEAAWERYKHDPLHITDRMKDAAHFSFKEGRISALPQWVAATRKDSGVKVCPNCAETIKSAAKQCRFCFATLTEEGKAIPRGEAPAFVPPSSDPEPERNESLIDRDLLNPPGVPEVEEPDPLAGKSDAEILSMADDALPEPKAARPGKPRRNQNQNSEE